MIYPYLEGINLRFKHPLEIPKEFVFAPLSQSEIDKLDGMQRYNYRLEKRIIKEYETEIKVKQDLEKYEVEQEHMNILEHRQQRQQAPGYNQAQDKDSKSYPSYSYQPPHNYQMSYQYQYTPPKDNMKDNENQRFNQENNRASVDGGSMQSGNVGANTFDNTTPTLPPKPLGMEYSSQQEQQQHQQRMERYGNIKKQYEEPSAPPLPPKPKEMGSLEWSFDESDGNNGSLGMHIEAGLIAGTSAGGATGEHTLLTQVKELESMGFPEEKAILALEMYDYDIEKATNYLLDHYML